MIIKNQVITAETVGRNHLNTVSTKNTCIRQKPWWMYLVFPFILWHYWRFHRTLLLILFLKIKVFIQQGRLCPGLKAQPGLSPMAPASHSLWLDGLDFWISPPFFLTRGLIEDFCPKRTWSHALKHMKIIITSLHDRTHFNTRKAERTQFQNKRTLR